MGNLKWKPARVGDPLLDRNFADLADKLSGIDDVLQALDVPDVSRVVRATKVLDEDFIDYRGPGGHAIELCPANDAGTGRARVVYVANNGATAITVKAQGQETVNGLSTVSVAAGSMLLAVSNGFDTWRALVTTTPVARAGHIIQDNGADKTQRTHMNIIGATITDDSVNDATKVTIAAGHVIQDNGSNQTQRANLDFIGFTVADDSVNNRTKVTAPGANQAGHIIQAREVDQTQRLHLDFATGANVDDVSASDRTRVKIKFPGLDWVWDSAAWYAAPAVIDPAAATTSIAISANAGDTGILWAFPMYFGRDGTITKIAQRHSGGTGSGGSKSWQAIYSASATGELPDVRLADAEQVSTGFGTHSESTINLAVRAGTILWFAITLNAQETSNGFPRVPMEMMRPTLGTNYDGAAGTDFTFRMGYKPAFVYGRPPSSWGATGTTKILRANGLVPALLFKFTPDSV